LQLRTSGNSWTPGLRKSFAICILMTELLGSGINWFTRLCRRLKEFHLRKLAIAELIIFIEDGRDNSDDTELNCKLEQLLSELEELYTRIISKIPLESRHQTFSRGQNFVSIDFVHQALPIYLEWCLSSRLRRKPSR
jgi:hypothetical protein